MEAQLPWDRRSYQAFVSAAAVHLRSIGFESVLQQRTLHRRRAGHFRQRTTRRQEHTSQRRTITSLAHMLEMRFTHFRYSSTKERKHIKITVVTWLAEVVEDVVVRDAACVPPPWRS